MRRGRVKARRIGLALGGGAARGWAHLGVLSLLDEIGVTPSVICGTSIGAVVGALKASGRLPAALDEIMGADLIRVLSYVSPGIREGALIDSRRIHNLLRAWFGHADIGDLQAPFAAVATDIATGDAVVLRSGDLVSALMASIAIPAIFPPRFTRGRWLSDGGLSDPIPVGAARALGADAVIAVGLNSRTAGIGSGDGDGTDGGNGGSAGRKPSLNAVLLSTLMIAERNLAASRLSLDRPEVLIEPDMSGFVGSEFHRARELSAIGYESARAASDALLALGG